jgi:hypothetical protein
MVFLPELDIPTIKARVDSGAKHPHAINIAPFIKNETNWVHLILTLFRTICYSL